MKKIHKITNIALIFMLIGVVLFEGTVYALRPPFLFNEENQKFIDSKEKSLKATQPKKIGYQRVLEIVNVGGKQLTVVAEEKVNPDLVEPQKIIIPQKEEEREIQELADRALRGGSVGLITVAGGMSFRAGIDYPKGMTPITPLSRRTLFQNMADELKAARSHYGRPILWFIMTSEHTDEETRKYFSKENYFDLGKENIIFIKQESVPTFISGTQLVAKKDMDTVLTTPDGSGGIYKAMQNASARGDNARISALEEAKNRGISTFLYTHVDNGLPVINRTLLGYHLKEKSDYTTTLIRKRDPEEGLAMVAIDKTTQAKFFVEYNQPAAEIIRYREGYEYGSINRNIFSRHFLETVEPPPFYVIKGKKAKIFSDGAVRDKKIDKFESFVFDNFGLARISISVALPREECLAAFKRTEGPDSPENVGRAISNYSKILIKKALQDIDIPGEMLIELPPIANFMTLGELRELLRAINLVSYIKEEDIIGLQVNQDFNTVEVLRKGETYTETEVSIAGLPYNLVVDKEDVHWPLDDTTKLLIGVLKRYFDERDLSSMDVLDMGSGTGVISLSVAQLIDGGSITAVDNNEKAIELSRHNIERFGLSERIEVQPPGDLFENLRGRRFDLIIFNPPGWWSGRYHTTERFLKELHEHLKDGGEAIVIWPIEFWRSPSEEEPATTEDDLKKLAKKYGLDVATIEKKGQYGAYKIAQPKQKLTPDKTRLVKKSKNHSKLNINVGSVIISNEDEILHKYKPQLIAHLRAFADRIYKHGVKLTGTTKDEGFLERAITAQSHAEALINYIRREELTPEHHLLLAKKDGEIIGATIFRVKGVLDLGIAVVHPAYQRQGIGRAMQRWKVRLAKGSRLTKAKMYVKEDNISMLEGMKEGGRLRETYREDGLLVEEAEVPRGKNTYRFTFKILDSPVDTPSHQDQKLTPGKTAKEVQFVKEEGRWNEAPGGEKWYEIQYKGKIRGHIWYEVKKDVIKVDAISIPTNIEDWEDVYRAVLFEVRNIALKENVEKVHFGKVSNDIFLKYILEYFSIEGIKTKGTDWFMPSVIGGEIKPWQFLLVPKAGRGFTITIYEEQTSKGLKSVYPFSRGPNFTISEKEGNLIITPKALRKVEGPGVIDNYTISYDEENRRFRVTREESRIIMSNFDFQLNEGYLDSDLEMICTVKSLSSVIEQRAAQTGL